ncbi:MAG: hypothetical protein WA190_17700 [Usitatibacter sp.]
MTKPVNRPHNKAGRKKREPTANTAAQIRKLAATGHSVIGIARGLKVAHVVLTRWLDEYPDLAEAMAQGRESERLTLHNGLFRAAKRGNIVAAIFLLKARHGYREGDQSEVANKVSVTFSLPGALKPDEFNVIEHEPTTPNLPVPATRISRS